MSFFWWLSDDRKLAKNARHLIATPTMTCRELGIGLGNIDQRSIRASEIELDDLENAIVKNGFRPLPIGIQHALTAGRLPNIHRDPFDRMLAAQANVEELRVVSHDRSIRALRLAAEGLPPIIV